MTFKRGDVVRLKSGGPAMTVEHVGAGLDNTRMVDCVWFQGTQTVRGNFAADALALDN